MLSLTIPETEYFDEREGLFISVASQTILLEHSLMSLAAWESKWHKPFFSKEKKTREEELDYIKCMTITKNVNPLVYRGLVNTHFSKIRDYIDDPMTATTFVKNLNTKPNRNVITAEIIYYWMIALNIPFECQRWHLNRLMTLIKVCDIKSSPSKKMSKKDIYAQNRALNAARRQKLNTKG